MHNNASEAIRKHDIHNDNLNSREWVLKGGGEAHRTLSADLLLATLPSLPICGGFGL